MIIVITIPWIHLCLLSMHLKDTKAFQEYPQLLREKATHLRLRRLRGDVISSQRQKIEKNLVPMKQKENKRIWCQSSRKKIKTIFQNSLHPTIFITNVASELASLFYLLCKFGDQFHFQKHILFYGSSINMLQDFSFGFTGAITYLHQKH